MLLILKYENIFTNVDVTRISPFLIYKLKYIKLKLTYEPIILN